MTSVRRLLAILVVLSAVFAIALAQDKLSAPKAQTSQPSTSTYEPWKHGPATDANFFPLAVWLQDPKNAPKFQALGINTYVGLWQGPNESQLAELKKHGMKVICEFNDVARKHLDDPTIIGWMHGDEPDNAQDIAHWKTPEQIRQAWPEAPDRTLKQWGAYGPPIPPKEIVADYQRIRQADPSRPVMLNLGQGVAFDKYVGRGYRSGHLEDYPEYMKGCDIVSFDIYPAVHDSPQVRGNLWYVPRGVERLCQWSGSKKVVWNCIECTHIGDAKAIASGEQIRSEVWMSIIHGSRGLIYFVHEFKPKFIEAGLLAHDEQAKAVAAVNKQILSLAAVINSPDGSPITVESKDKDAPVAAMLRRHNGSAYIFAVAMRDKPATASFKVDGLADGEAQVVDENRTVAVKAGFFEDNFKPYEVHIYRASLR